MEKTIKKLSIVFSILVVLFLYGCKGNTAKSGSDINEDAKEQIDTLAELAKNIGKYDDVDDFIFNGYAFVWKDEKMGVIDKTGTLVLDCNLEYVDDIVPPYVVAGKKEKLGIIKFGEIAVCNYIYDEIHLCNHPSFEDLAIVRSNRLVGIITLQGKVVVPCKYDEIFEDDGLFKIEKDGNYGWMDDKGEVIIPPQYDNSGSLRFWGNNFEEEFAVVKNISEDACGFIDKNGNQITAFKYDPDYTHPYHEGYALARELDGEKRFVIIDDKGNETFLPKGIYAIEWEFSEGLVPVLNAQTDKYGYINTQGNLIIDFKYQTAKSFHNGLAIASYGFGSVGYINKRGEIVIPFIYGDSYTSEFRNGIAKIEDSRHYSTDGYDNVGYIDTKGNIIISPSEYEHVGKYHEGMVCVKKGGKYGFCNTKGVLVVPCVYDDWAGDAEGPYFTSGLARVKLNGKIGFVDKLGNSTFDKLKEQ